MAWHAHYFILNEAHEPVEVTQHEWIHWCVKHETIKDTRVGSRFRVRTAWSGMIDDVTMPGPPWFTHFLEGPGLHGKRAKTIRYEDALARHDRIVEWLRKRAARFERI